MRRDRERAIGLAMLESCGFLGPTPRPKARGLPPQDREPPAPAPKTDDAA